LRYLTILLFFSLVTLEAIGQNAYLITESTQTYGINIVDGGDSQNSKFCILDQGGKFLQYSPSEVLEYGLKNGKVYISKSIQIADTSERVFLERVIKGNISLFYYGGSGHRKYFIGNGSSKLVELVNDKPGDPASSYRVLLKNATRDCQLINDDLKQVRFTKTSLTKFFTLYEKCGEKIFPSFRCGMMFGYELSKLIPSVKMAPYLNDFSYEYDGGFTPGLFIEEPILMSNFSLHAEMYFSHFSYSLTETVNNRNIEFSANISSTKIPLLIRYYHHISKNRIFINTGVIIADNYKNDNYFNGLSLSSKKVTSNVSGQSEFIQKTQVGYVIGSGLEFKLGSRNFLFIELRYDRLAGKSDTMDNSEIHLLTGINF
jgi:hypothetical protein